MTDNDELFNEERNIMLLVLLSLKAYHAEEGDVFSVSTELLNNTIVEAIETGDSVPEISISTVGERTFFKIGLREPTADEVQKIAIKGEE